MTQHVEVPLPDRLYQQVKQWADIRHQELGEAIADYLANTLLKEPSKIPFAEPDPEVEAESEAFLRLHPDLWENLPEEYVAIYGGQMVDHDADKVALLNRIEQRYPEQFVLVRQVRQEPEIVYKHHSIRWAQEG